MVTDWGHLDYRILSVRMSLREILVLPECRNVQVEGRCCIVANGTREDFSGLNSIEESVKEHRNVKNACLTYTAEHEIYRGQVVHRLGLLP